MNQSYRAFISDMRGTVRLTERGGRRSRKGHLQFFMKEYDKALATYEAGLAHDPNNAELKEGVARCYEALDKVTALAFADV